MCVEFFNVCFNSLIWFMLFGLYILPRIGAVVQSLVEAGSNTSTVDLRVVGGDEKGSLESGTVKYGRESHGTRTQE
jgi:hypothetical protein